MGWFGDVNIQRPETASYGESMREALTAQIDLAPELHAAEASQTFGRPAYVRMETKLLEDTILGSRKLPEGAKEVTSKRHQYELYIDSHKNLKKLWQAEKRKPDRTRKKWEVGRDHWKAHGKKDGYNFPSEVGTFYDIKKYKTISIEDQPREGGMADLMGSTKEMPDGRKPGFSKDGEFQGMTVLGEDLRTQAASAQREDDIKDVENNLVAYQAIMKEARPETISQLDSAVTALNEESKRLTGDTITDPNNLRKVAQTLQKGDFEGMVTAQAQTDRLPLQEMTAGVREAGAGVGRGGPIPGQPGGPGRPPPDVGIDPLAQMAGQAQPGARIDALEMGGVPFSDPRQAEMQAARGARGAPAPFQEGYDTDGGRGIPREVADGQQLGAAQQAQQGGQLGAARAAPMGGQMDPYAEVMRGEAGQLATGYRGRADQMALGERGTADQMGGYSALSDPFGLRQTMQQQAAEDLAAGRGLSPRQRREAEQSARRWGQAAGRGLDPLSAVREVEELMEMRGTEEARRRAFAGQVIGQEAALQTGELGRGMQQAGFNIQNEVARREANLGRRLTEQEFNTMQDTARREANIGREMGAEQFNIQQEVARQEANLGRRLSAQEFNTLQDAARQEANIARVTEAERYNIGMGEQRTEADIARDLGMQQFNIQAGEQRREADIGRELGAESSRITMQMQQEQMNEQLRQRQLQGYLGGVGQVAGMEQQMLGDPLQAIIGRPAGTTGFGMGQQMYGGSQYGLTSGPGVAFNPEAGLSYMLGQQGNEANLLAAEAGASAQKSAGMMGGIGAMAGGFLGNPGLFK